MILKNKKALILSSLLILLPVAAGIALWGRFPDYLQLDWFLWMPVLMLALHWLCIYFTAKDPGNKGRNRKPLSLVLWVIPLISNLSFCGLFALALDVEFSPVAWTVIPMGILFVAIGNYLPKTRMNSTMGIKIYWAYTSEENWNATHRFAGKVWVIGGILIALCALLPHLWAVTAMFVIIAVLCIIPMVYSWRYYRRELAEGKELTHPSTRATKKAKKLSAVFLVVLVVFLSIVLFCSRIDFLFREDHLLIDTNMYSDNILYYDAIEDVEYREGNVPGLRVGGYGSFRLLMGYFENEEFGTYIRYTYYKPEACVVVRLQKQVLVLSGATVEETEALYQQLLTKCQ